MTTFERFFRNTCSNDYSDDRLDLSPSSSSTDRFGNAVQSPYNRSGAILSSTTGVGTSKGKTTRENATRHANNDHSSHAQKSKSIEKESMTFPEETFSEKSGDKLLKPNKSKNDYLRLSFSELLQRTKFIIDG
jgi:hypothetical protein